MVGQNIQLSFKCPKKWDSLQPQEGGRFCADCQKPVRDFLNIPLKNLQQDLPCSEEELCGSFHAYQLHNPFGNWKDKLISFYQKKVRDTYSDKFSKKISLFLLAVALVVTGCHRRTMGAIALFDGSNPRYLKGPGVTKTALPPPGKGN